MKSLHVLVMMSVIAGLPGCVVDAEEADEGEDIDSTSLEVQSAYSPEHFAVAYFGDQQGVKATGMISVPFRNPQNNQPLMVGNTPVRGTCGVTFITPRYAITAAHCVDAESVLDPATENLVVESYNVSTASFSNIQATFAVSGSYPNYTHNTLSAANGYQRTVYNQCKVVSRCGKDFGDYNCKGSGVIQDDATDVALIRCADRAQNAPYVKVAASDPATGAVEMYWYHEVLDMPTSAPAPGDAVAQDRFDHYTLWPAMTLDKGNNFHYLGGDKNQIFPLRSLPWMLGDIVVQRWRLGQSGNIVWTDLFGCHGTSGSGVMQRSNAGQLELLGPVAAGSAALFGTGTAANPNRLCVNADASTYSDKILAYTKLEHTRKIAQIAFNDASENVSPVAPVQVTQQIIAPIPSIVLR